MNTGEDLDVNQKAGWLNLSLASNYSGDSGSQSTPTKSSMKVYTCSFCKRKFEKAQALGGHQNGHRRERDAARRYLISNVTKFPLIHMHSLPGTVGETSTTSTIARFTDNGSGNGDICRQTHGAEESSVDLMMKWIGGVYSNDQPECRKSDPISLDLTLKLSSGSSQAGRPVYLASTLKFQERLLIA